MKKNMEKPPADKAEDKDKESEIPQAICGNSVILGSFKDQVSNNNEGEGNKKTVRIHGDRPKFE